MMQVTTTQNASPPSDPSRPSPAAPDPNLAPRLSRRRKAAVIVQMLLADGQKLSLSSLPEDVQLNLTRELADLRIVDRETMQKVAREFARDLERVGIAVPGGVEAALKRLADQISPTTAARIRSELAESDQDPWSQIVALSAQDLVPVMEEESTEVAAVVMSKLPVGKAAALLGLLPGEMARRITYAMSQTSDVRQDAVQRIGAAIARSHCAKPAPVFESPPPKRVGAILNSSVAATRDHVLEGLSSDDPGFADEVRKSIFTFADIPERISTPDVPKITRDIEDAVLVTALTAALAAGGDLAQAAEFILSNISQRMADALREEIADKGRIRRAAGEEAMGDVVRAIRAAADSGELTLIEVEQEDEDD
ncbi:FliG C-terminal domain-containing protein [Alexandriicola marinus]|uniref:FliG C-terminal domain-containing protein n=1 Tax=Alexandriicola marinus TaxID=2081710 RepID=UPI001EEF721F|nr:FliG C-terminal domain-containing protein [Alexandriicola marinus]